jgi:chemotaxis protein methyltransferase CheR
MPGSLLESDTPARTLSDACGLPIGAYRRDHVHACLVRVMRREQTPDVPALIKLLDDDAAIRTALRRAIAVSTTGLFRDPTQLRWLDREVMPSLTTGATHLRVWSAGCSAGEEAFTLAMMLEWHGMLARSEVVGSDILEESLAEGDSGMVGGARIPANLRGRVHWDKRDLTSDDPPEGEFDLVLCRNVMSFLTPVAAEAVGRALASSLALGGVVALGRDERIEGATGMGLVAIAPNTYRRFRYVE